MKWNSWSTAEYDPAQAQALEAVTGSPLVAAVLSARGCASPGEARDFLARDTAALGDPLQMADAERGAARVRSAITAGETVAVYGDYDVDGITATAMVADYLEQKGCIPLVHIPDRLEEGYGLSEAALEDLARAGATLVITVDCGITAVGEAEAARAMGLDLVITDHHACTETLPAAAAVLNPRRPDCPYPDKNLAGVAVAFTLLRALEGPGGTEALLERYGDLLALGTVADVMELTGENRIFVSAGLEQLRRGRRGGLSSLMGAAGLDIQRVTASNIGFGIAPRLNAAGRMGSPDLALSLLREGDGARAAALAAELHTLNDLRRETERRILDEALAALEAASYEGGPVVLASETWHQGVAGIVAARLAERFGEPAIVLCVEDGRAKGSGRSARGFPLLDALTACSGHLERFGGHAQAAGLTLAAAAIPRFQADFRAYYGAHPPVEELSALEADFTVGSPGYLTLSQVQSLELLEPCGRGNPEPVLVLEGARLTRVQPIGGGRHVKLQVEKWGETYDCVFFSVSPDTLGAGEGDTVDLAFTPQVNAFRGRRTVQLRLLDICPHGRRQTGRAKGLCDRLAEGRAVPGTLAAALCPQRDDFARLWRLLKGGEGQAVSGTTEDVLEALSKGGGAGKSYICLKVFDELGLATVREQAGCLDVRLFPEAKKVDLNASKMLTALREAMQ